MDPNLVGGQDVPASVDEGGGVTFMVPNKRVARLVQLGVHAERAQRQRIARRKAQRLARRRNRSK